MADKKPYAEKIQDYILGLEREREPEKAVPQDRVVQQDQAVRVVGTEGDAYRLQVPEVPDEIKNLTPGERIGTYVSNEKTLGYAPVRIDGNGNFYIKKDEIQWNKNPNIRLSLEKDENGRKYLQMDGAIKARSYVDVPKPFHELKWEMDREKTFDLDRELERGLDR